MGRGLLQRVVFVGLVLTLGLVSLLGPLETVAAGPGRPLNIQTSPLPINLAVDPGKSVATELRVKQASGQTERLQVSLMKFAAYGEEGKPQLMDREPYDTS